MTKEALITTIEYIVSRGFQAIEENMGQQTVELDYLAIFAKDEHEYEEFEKVVELLGEEIDKETARTGRTFLLAEPIATLGGQLTALKIRKPDPTRPQRGAPDFKVHGYEELKKQFLEKSGNFTLMIRHDYEMIELKGIDVLVYIPSKTLSERMKA